MISRISLQQQKAEIGDWVRQADPADIKACANNFTQMVPLTPAEPWVHKWADGTGTHNVSEQEWK